MEKFICKDQTFMLLPDKALLWEEENTMLIADLHIGKVGHFRKNGIAVPNKAGTNNLWRLSNLLMDHKPEKVIFMGDLFHSTMNASWDEFADFLASFPAIDFVLVRGNHDILAATAFIHAGIALIDSLEIGPFLLTHDRKDSDRYNIHGHIHPGVRLHGGGRQRVTLPCFFFARDYAVLPSFGDFTGMYALKATEGDDIFVIADRQVWKVS